MKEEKSAAVRHWLRRTPLRYGCEERSDEAIQHIFSGLLHRFAVRNDERCTLAMEARKQAIGAATLSS